MVSFYVKMILCGKMTLDDVPVRWFDAVKAALKNT